MGRDDHAARRRGHHADLRPPRRHVRQAPHRAGARGRPRRRVGHRGAVARHRRPRRRARLAGCGHRRRAARHLDPARRAAPGSRRRGDRPHQRDPRRGRRARDAAQRPRHAVQRLARPVLARRWPGRAGVRAGAAHRAAERAAHGRPLRLCGGCGAHGGAHRHPARDLAGQRVGLGVARGARERHRGRGRAAGVGLVRAAHARSPARPARRGAPPGAADERRVDRDGLRAVHVERRLPAGARAAGARGVRPVAPRGEPHRRPVGAHDDAPLARRRAPRAHSARGSSSPSARSR